ncbi:hypothetical protein [Burkholderia cepacia]|uniref:hypothetical protein n=1 Tax=Burkholderia cepacia TaxID=292 RepID=UPI0021499A06|nr:hypothetical protein [Burkholderia cepacia]
MSYTYEICGALSVLDSFRHYDAQQFAQTIADPADIYFATDAVTHSLVIRIRGTLTDDEAAEVENAVTELSRKWARAGTIFRRVRYGQSSFIPVGLAQHVELLEELADEHVQLEAFLQRQTRILERFRQPAT